jgi:hypothetical protein
MGRDRRERRAVDRGVVSVLSVFFVLLLLTFLAVSINLGRLLRSRGDLQHAADSAVLAAVESLDVKMAGGPSAGRAAGDFDPMSTWSVPDTAVQHAHAFTMMNGVGQVPSLDPVADVSFGFWHLRGPELCVFSAGSMCGPGWEATPGAPASNSFHMFAVNAVRASTHYPLPAYFGNFLGVGTTNMSARARAFGRRTRVPCAIASAVSVCQIIDLSGPGTGFTCPGGTINRTFVSNETVHPNALGRIDLVGQWDPAETFMRDYVREKDFRQCELDSTYMPAVNEYVAGDAMMPGETAEPRANIQPVIEALAGVSSDGGNHEPGRCLLGQKLVVPVVQPTGIETPGDCMNICPPGPSPPPGTVPTGCIPWPSVGVQRVVGFVNITFTKLHCWHEAASPGKPWVQPPLTAGNCETQLDPDPDNLGSLLATTCSGDNGMAWADQAGLSVDAEITCDAPVGAPATPQLSFRPRMVE